MASTEQIMLPGAVKAPILTVEASRSWGSLHLLRQQTLAFGRTVVPGFQFLLRHEPCKSLDPAEGTTVPSVFLLQGAMATQNEHVGPPKAADSHPVQSVPLQLLLIFPPQPSSEWSMGTT